MYLHHRGRRSLKIAKRCTSNINSKIIVVLCFNINSMKQKNILISCCTKSKEIYVISSRCAQKLYPLRGRKSRKVQMGITAQRVKGTSLTWLTQMCTMEVDRPVDFLYWVLCWPLRDLHCATIVKPSKNWMVQFNHKIRFDVCTLLFMYWFWIFLINEAFVFAWLFVLHRQLSR